MAKPSVLPPISLPWAMKALTSAVTRFEAPSPGCKQLIIHHELLRGVTPHMLVQWFGKLIVGTVTIEGRVLPAYRVWHPVDHIALKIVTPSPTGMPGIARGAVVRIQEAFAGNPAWLIDNLATVERMDELGVTLKATTAGIEYMRLEHRFTATSVGTLYSSQLRIGTSLPGLSHLSQRSLDRLMPDDKARAWFAHNVEEVGNLQFFLPALCAANQGTAPL